MPEEAAPKCARCGLEFGCEPGQCGDFTGNPAERDALDRLDARVECRDRELKSVRAMLTRSIRQLRRVSVALEGIEEEIP